MKIFAFFVFNFVRVYWDFVWFSEILEGIIRIFDGFGGILFKF